MRLTITGCMTCTGTYLSGAGTVIVLSGCYAAGAGTSTVRSCVLRIGATSTRTTGTASSASGWFVLIKNMKIFAWGGEGTNKRKLIHFGGSCRERRERGVVVSVIAVYAGAIAPMMELNMSKPFYGILASLIKWGN